MLLPIIMQANGTLVQVTVAGASYFGVRHGLETLLQLIAFDSENECLQVCCMQKMVFQ